jgi:hypothetical protein
MHSKLITGSGAMKEDDEALDELWRVKESLAARFGSLHELAKEARRVAKAEPLPAPGKHRKLLEGFPPGQSVGDSDPILDEVWQAKEAFAKRFGYDLHRLAEFFRREDRATASRPRKGPLKTVKFRTAKGKSADKRNGKG